MKNYQRVLSLILCVSLLSFFVLSPLCVRSSASIAGSVTIGFAGSVSSVAPYLVPIIVILLGVVEVGRNWDEIVAEAERIYNRASSSVQTWCSNVYQQVIDGTSVFKIPTEVKNTVEEDKKYILPPDMPFFFMPTDLMSLDSLSRDDVFAQTVSGAIQEGNELTAQSNNLLTSIRSFLGYAFEGLSSDLTSLGEDISAQTSALHESITNLRNHMDNQTQQLKDLSFAINTNLKSELIQTKELVYSINTNVKSELQQLKDLSFSINNNMQRKFNELSAAITGSIASLEASIAGSLASTAVRPDSPTTDEDERNKVYLNDFFMGGFESSKEYFGFADDFLFDEITGFLVVGKIFNLYAGVPFFNRLLVISCSIGIIGVLLGVVMEAKYFTVVQRRRDAAAQAAARSRMERSRAT